MEFVRQLVAFSILMDSSEGIMERSGDQVSDAWIFIANSSTEAMLEGFLGPALTEKYRSWIDKWYGQPRSAPQETEPEVPPEPEEEQPTREEVKTFLEEEATSPPTKRRAKRVKSN